jgi:hypothetical protein
MEPMPTFFLGSLRYNVGMLSVVLEVDGEPSLEVTFAPPRAFRCYSESDQFSYLASFEGRPLVASSDRGCGVLLSDCGTYLTDYRTNVREQEPEDTYSGLILTPQECVEVICFEEPTIRRL